MNAADSGNGAGNDSPSIADTLALPRSGAQLLPPGPRIATRRARSSGTGAENRTRIGEIGTQPELRCSRSHSKLAVNGARTLNGSRWSCSEVTPVAAATPLPHTSVTRAALGNRCRACRTTSGPGAPWGYRVRTMASRARPVRTRMPTRCGRPSTAKPTWRSSDSGVGSASSSSMNACSSSIHSDPSRGTDSRIAGPPVENAKSVGPVTARPASVCSPARSRKRHAIPAGRSRAKSYTHWRESTHRPVPGSAQVTSKGSGVPRGSPSGTIGSENRAAAWRTCLTVPCGEKLATRGSSAARAGGAAWRPSAAPISASRRTRSLAVMRARGTRALGRRELRRARSGSPASR